MHNIILSLNKMSFWSNPHRKRVLQVEQPISVYKVIENGFINWTGMQK